MNLFRLGGDMLHLASFFILLVKIISQKQCKGLSLKTQFLYALVFITRYLDLFYNFTSFYNWVMKIVFITTSMGIVYLMKFRKPYCTSYDSKSDHFNIIFLIIPCFLLALVFNDNQGPFSLIEVLWAFSIYLEAVAIIPQLFVVHDMAKENRGFVENLTSHYVFTLGGYRTLYLFNWIWRYFTEEDYRNWVVWIAGLVQTAIYCDFFYYYIYATVYGRNFVLPI